MNIKCPKCLSHAVDRKDHARKVGTTVGLAAGTASSITAVNYGADIGTKAAAVFGPNCLAIGGILGTILCIMGGATSGAIVGSTLGGVVDDNLLDNFICLQCNHQFTCKK